MIGIKSSLKEGEVNEKMNDGQGLFVVVGERSGASDFRRSM